MVDRITPATTPEVIENLKDEFGVEDQWPVVAEPFTSWVLEDDFSDGRPPLEDVDVLLVDDVTPYELMKLRLLNASHQSLCYFAYLSGYRLVHDAARRPAVRRVPDALHGYRGDADAAAGAGIDLPDYKRTLIERFANPGVRDTIARLCFGSSDRIPKWLLPVVRANLASGGPVRLSAATVASWARYAEGVDEQGEPIDVQDQLAGHARSAGPVATRQSTAFIENTDGVRGSRHIRSLRRGLPLGAGLIAPRRREGRHWRL